MRKGALLVACAQPPIKAKNICNLQAGMMQPAWPRRRAAWWPHMLARWSAWASHPPGPLCRCSFVGRVEQVLHHQLEACMPHTCVRAYLRMLDLLYEHKV